MHIYSLRNQNRMAKELDAVLVMNLGVSFKLTENVKKRLEILEQELKSNKPDAGKIQNHWKWLRRNASWVVPMITEVVIEGMKIALGR